MRPTVRRPVALSARTLAVLAAALSPLPAAGADGALDTTFGIGGKQRVFFDRAPDLTDYGLAISLQADGKILLAGKAEASTSDAQPGTARLLPSGGLDSSFSNDGKATFSMHPTVSVSIPEAILERRTDGRILLVGSVLVGLDSGLALNALTPAGLFEPGFGNAATPGRVLYWGLPGGEELYGAYGAALQPDGKLLVCGAGVQAGKGDLDAYVARFTTTGTLDGSFSGDGVLWVPFDQGSTNSDACLALAVQPDGKIVAMTRISDADFDIDTGFLRVSSNGTFDSTFDGDGKLVWEVNDIFGNSNDQPNQLLVQPDGRILFAGYTEPTPDDAEVYFGRLLANGTLDPTLSIARPDLAHVEQYGNEVSIALQSDGRILVASADALECHVGRFLTTGEVDSSFGTAGVADVSGWSGDPASCHTLALDGGRAVVVGTSRGAAPDFDFLIARLTSALIFRDDFESGDLPAWSSAAP